MSKGEAEEVTGTWWRCKCGNQNPPLVFLCTEARCRRPRPDIPIEEPKPVPPKPEEPKSDPSKPHPNMPDWPPKPAPEPQPEPKPEQPKKKNPPPGLVKFGVWFGILASGLGVAAWFYPPLKPIVTFVAPLIKALLSILGV